MEREYLKVLRLDFEQFERRQRESERTRLARV
jgi:hypothetical protein